MVGMVAAASLRVFSSLSFSCLLWISHSSSGSGSLSIFSNMSMAELLGRVPGALNGSTLTDAGFPRRA
jgi:hypothetical protein